MLTLDYDKSENTQDNHVIFGTIGEPAQPIGGYEKFIETITNKLSYSDSMRVEGKVYVQYKIDTLGKMQDIKIIKGLNKLIDLEVLRVIKELNYPFEPAHDGSKKVMYQGVFPITLEKP